MRFKSAGTTAWHDAGIKYLHLPLWISLAYGGSKNLWKGSSVFPQGYLMATGNQSETVLAPKKQVPVAVKRPHQRHSRQMTQNEAKSKEPIVRFTIFSHLYHIPIRQKLLEGSGDKHHAVSGRKHAAKVLSK